LDYAARTGVVARKGLAGRAREIVNPSTVQAISMELAGRPFDGSHATIQSAVTDPSAQGPSRPGTDIRHIAGGLRGEICSAANDPLFDHLLGEGQQHVRHVSPERSSFAARLPRRLTGPALKGVRK